MDYIEVLSPEGNFPQKQSRRQARKVNLSGKRIGTLCNNKHNADKFLEHLLGYIQKDIPDMSVSCRLTKPHTAQAAPDQMYEELANKCDVVIAGTGD